MTGPAWARLADRIWASWDPEDRSAYVSVWALHDEMQPARDQLAREIGAPTPVEPLDWRKACADLHARVEAWRERCSLCHGAEGMAVPCRAPGCRGGACPHGPGWRACPRCQEGAGAPPAA